MPRSLEEQNEHEPYEGDDDLQKVLPLEYSALLLVHKHSCILLGHGVLTPHVTEIYLDLVRITRVLSLFCVCFTYSPTLVFIPRALRDLRVGELFYAVYLNLKGFVRDRRRKSRFVSLQIGR